MLAASAAAPWPLAYAQTAQRLRRVGVLLYLAPDDPEAKTYAAAFIAGLQEQGWVVGRNVQVDFRYTSGDLDVDPQAYAVLKRDAEGVRYSGTAFTTL